MMNYIEELEKELSGLSVENQIEKVDIIRSILLKYIERLVYDDLKIGDEVLFKHGNFGKKAIVTGKSDEHKEVFLLAYNKEGMFESRIIYGSFLPEISKTGRSFEGIEKLNEFVESSKEEK